jgi:transposase
MLILSFDLGDFNAQSAWFLHDRNTGTKKRGKVKATQEALGALLAKHRPDRVLCEACAMSSLLADTVEEVLPEASFVAASTNGEAWRWTNVKRKTDPADAEKLDRLDRLDELQPVLIPDGTIRALRRLLAHRRKLVHRRTACYNAIRHACKQHQVLLPGGEQAWNNAGLTGLEERCRHLIDARAVAIDWDTTWLLELLHLVQQVRMFNAQLKTVDRSFALMRRETDQIQRLQTAPGAGIVTATALLAFIGDPRRFRTGKQVTAYAGLVPRVFQSGDTCRHGRITKAGNRVLRALMIQAAWTAKRTNPWVAKRFDRICGGSETRRRIAIVAVARDLLVRYWKMMVDGTEWIDPEKNQSQRVA